MSFESIEKRLHGKSMVVEFEWNENEGRVDVTWRNKKMKNTEGILFAIALQKASTAGIIGSMQIINQVCGTEVEAKSFAAVIEDLQNKFVSNDNIISMKKTNKEGNLTDTF